MNKKTIVDNEIGSRYLQGKLTPDELAEFETYLLTHPDLVAELELDSVMYKVMPQVENMEKATGSWRFLDLPLRQVLAPLFASMIMVPMVILALFNDANIPNIQPVFLTSDTYRTADNSFSNMATLRFEEEDEVILLMLYPENELADDFKVILRDTSGGVEQIFTDLARGESGYVSIQLPASAVGEGEYILDITQDTSVDEILEQSAESIRLRVVKDS